MSCLELASPARCAVLMLSLACTSCVTRSDEGVAIVPDTETTRPATNEAYRVGRVNLAAGNFGLAERNFREAVERNAQDTASWIGLAAAYDNLGRFELADRAYTQAVALGGETIQVLNNRGYSYLLRGDGRQALTQFERAAELDPDNPVIRNNVTLLRLGQRPTRSAPF